jgi:hypothetical protein
MAAPRRLNGRRERDAAGVGRWLSARVRAVPQGLRPAIARGRHPGRRAQRADPGPVPATDPVSLRYLLEYLNYFVYFSSSQI